MCQRFREENTKLLAENEKLTAELAAARAAIVEMYEKRPANYPEYMATLSGRSWKVINDAVMDARFWAAQKANHA